MNDLPANILAQLEAVDAVLQAQEDNPAFQRGFWDRINGNPAAPGLYDRSAHALRSREQGWSLGEHTAELVVGKACGAVLEDGRQVAAMAVVARPARARGPARACWLRVGWRDPDTRRSYPSASDLEFAWSQANPAWKLGLMRASVGAGGRASRIGQPRAA